LQRMAAGSLGSGALPPLPADSTPAVAGCDEVPATATVPAAGGIAAGGGGLGVVTGVVDGGTMTAVGAVAPA
jgi:hypothetical protein